MCSVVNSDDETSNSHGNNKLKAEDQENNVAAEEAQTDKVKEISPQDTKEAKTEEKAVKVPVVEEPCIEVKRPELEAKKADKEDVQKRVPVVEEPCIEVKRPELGAEKSDKEDAQKRVPVTEEPCVEVNRPELGGGEAVNNGNVPKSTDNGNKPAKTGHSIADLIGESGDKKKVEPPPSPTKRPLEKSDDESNESPAVKKTKMTEEDPVGTEVTDPPVVVSGNGSGADNEAGNARPRVGEAIEEAVVFFTGNGSGAENLARNSRSNGIDHAEEEDEEDKGKFSRHLRPL